MKPDFEFQSEDVVIIRHLLKHKSVSLVELHHSARLSPAQLHAAVERLGAAGLIERNDLTVSLTEEAHSRLFALRRMLFGRPRTWTGLPEAFASSAAHTETYIPRFDHLDRRILKFSERDEKRR